MTVAAKSRSSLHKGKCDFNKLVLKIIIYVGPFQLYKPSFTAKYAPQKLIAK